MCPCSTKPAFRRRLRTTSSRSIPGKPKSLRNCEACTDGELKKMNKPRHYIGDAVTGERFGPANYETRHDAAAKMHEPRYYRGRSPAVCSLHMEPLQLRMLGQNVTFSRCQWEELLTELNPDAQRTAGTPNLYERITELLKLEES